MDSRCRFAPTLLILFSLAGTCWGIPATEPIKAEQITQWEYGTPWAREAGTIHASTDTAVQHDGKPTLRIEHAGARDWSVAPAPMSGTKGALPVREGNILELSAWLKLQGTGNADLSFATYDAGGKIVEWQFGIQSTEQAENWREVRTRIVVPHGVATLQPRLTGDGAATLWMEGFTVRRAGNIATLRARDLPATVTIENAALSIQLGCNDLALSVLDKRSNRKWKQAAGDREMVLTSITAMKTGLTLQLLQASTGLVLRGVVQLDADSPEFTFALNSDGPLAHRLAFPHPFLTDKGTELVVPMNEGISYPVDDPSVDPMELIAYGGHGICMAFWGVADGSGAGHMAIIETPDDATLKLQRIDGLLCAQPEWDTQKGAFGYERKLRYVFFERGGHVAMCKRYREYARKIGLLKTLAQKRETNPNIDLLVGAVNVWCWERDSVAIIKEMQAAGIERILWSNRGSPKSIAAMNAMTGVLTSRYDIYQDVMDPARFSLLRYVQPDWPTAAWPKDLMRAANGDWVRGWEVEARDGTTRYPCGVLCDRQAIPYAEARLTDDLKDHPYRCRFIDTTTAAPWRECYDTDHPMTRSDSRHWKMELLRLMSEKFGMVTGSETGQDAAVPYVDYFEGMLSLGPYRIPEAGRDMQRIWTDVPPRVMKFQMGHAYRLPLWELVYHDCVVAQWYWGDYNNKLPALWDKRDLFNVLYGTPPMFMFDRQFWEANKERFVRSYQATCPVARATGYSEMRDHAFLTPDRAVQRTRFANGVSVTVNFGDAPFKVADGSVIPAGGFKVEGMR